MSLKNIPQCLRVRRQWVVFDVHTLDDGTISKLPRKANSFERASVDDPSTWCTFQEACEDGAHPTFVLTAHDPFVFIDLDAPKRKRKETDAEYERRVEYAAQINEAILQTFDSYQEMSVSGKGIHIILTGKLRGPGTKKQDIGVELYDRGRFCIFTGNIFHASEVNEAPAKELEQLEDFLRQAPIALVNNIPLDPGTEVRADSEVLADVLKVSRCQLLYEGRWREAGDYPGNQSDADFDFIAEIYRKTDSVMQVKRIFAGSALYRPNKVADYVERIVRYINGERAANQKIADNMRAFTEAQLNPPPPPNGSNGHLLGELLAQDEPVLDLPPEPVRKQDRRREIKSLRKIANELPDGMVKDLYHAYLKWAYYPLPEASLAAALTSAMLLFGRGYQTSTGLALKQWLIILGLTGSGKEIIDAGPSELLSRISLPAADSMWRGRPTSEQGLFRMLSSSPRIVIYLGECSAWFKDLCSPRASSHISLLRETLTGCYSKSDNNGVLRATEKADKSATDRVPRPCVILVGDSQPSNFYGAIDSDQILSGWLPRFSIVETEVSSMSLEPNSPRHDLPERLVADYKHIFEQMLIRDHQGQVEQVVLTEEAEVVLRNYERRIRRRTIEGGAEDDRHAQLVNRNGIKVRVYAALMAVAENWLEPRCDVHHVEWAMDFVDKITGDVMARMLSGDYDSSTTQQRPAMENLLNRLMALTEEERKTGNNARFFTTDTLQKTPWYIPLSIVREKVRFLRPFTSDTRSMGMIITGLLKDMAADGRILVMEKDAAWDQARCRGTMICMLTPEYWDMQEKANPLD